LLATSSSTSSRRIAAPHLERALALAEALDLPEVFAQTLNSKSIVLLRQNRLKEARILLEAAFESAVADDLPVTAARAANNLGTVLESADRYIEALSTYDRGIEISRRIGDRPWEGHLLGSKLATLVLLGRWDEALQSVEDSTGEWDSLGAGIYLAYIDCCRGQIAEGRARLDQYSTVRDSDNAESRASYFAVEALLLRAEGKSDPAFETLEREIPLKLDLLGVKSTHVKMMFVEALEAAFELRNSAKVEELLSRIDALRPGERPPLLTAHSARFRAKLEPELARAEAGFRRAEQLFGELGLIFWLAVTQMEHGERLVEQGRTEEGEPLLAEARETFERLEARPWLERLEPGEVSARTEVPV